MHERKCPVTGKLCQEERVYEITEHNGDLSNTVKCCRKCSVFHIEDRNRKAKYQELPMLPSAMEFLNSLMTELGLAKTTDHGITVPIQEQSKIVIVHDVTEKSCPGCGNTIDDILGKNAPRCEKCAPFYKGLVGDLIPDFAKKPSGHFKDAQTDSKGLIRQAAEIRLKQLQTQLEELIEAECFEKAAEIRDKIEALKKQYLN